ncbi:MAG: Na+/H+ antiporter NhaC family protein [Clostridia bacterium]|nr:Na+/H+ antiporter NhaC family protein [Clostridia bacterium]
MLNQKSKKKPIILIISAVVILTLLIVAVTTGAVNNVLDCPDCDTGWYECGDCEGTGLVDDELCTTCLEGVTVHNEHVVRCSTCGGETEVIGSAWALLPPIIAIGLALITKEVFSSLFIGILSGAILASDFNPVMTMDNVINTGLISAVAGTAGIFVFLVELGILVALINRAGGSAAFGEWAKTHVKTKIGATLATFVLGILIFIDDYFNCLTVGSVMRPVTDKHKISRSKFAYLIDATAAPICMIAPISSWAAAVSQYAADGQGLNLFIAAIPFNFYSLLTLVFVISLTLLKFDFGPMRKHEINAENGNLFSGEQIKQEDYKPSSRGKIIDLVLPIIALLIASVFALVYVGGIFDGKDFITAFGDTDATVALPWGGLIALVFTVIFFAIRKTVNFDESMKAIPQGFIAMVPAILILTFATSLKNMTGELGAAFFVGNLMNNAASGLMSFLPAIIFLVACVLSFATGTSWGTFGILIPIVTAMFAPDNPLMIISMSACLAGAVCGDHCSPISDTTIMSSAGAECEHLNHVSTQIPYAIFVAIISFVCYVIAGFVPYWYVMLPIGIAITIGALIVTKKVTAKYYAQNDTQNIE